MKIKFMLQGTALLVAVGSMEAADLHVSPTGADANPGTESAPVRTIQHAADLARPGDTVIVHKGVYRERISPPRGGESDAKRIIYQAAAGDLVEIKGSEMVRNWVNVGNQVWKVVLPAGFFGNFNPYDDLIHGDWFYPKDRKHHTGAVYLDGVCLTEAMDLDDVVKSPDSRLLWYGEVTGGSTTIWACFKGADPNQRQVEINVRRAVFYPEKPGMNFITVSGFTMRHAATPWAPPTAEQVGLIGTHWSKGWIIENNVISDSKCTGITLGKYGDDWDNKSESADAYNKTIERALKNGWNKDTIGHHLVRNNVISHCGQAGIVGSLGAIFSRITGNSIHDIHVERTYNGCEQAGIKFHAAIDVEIRGNHIYRAFRGIWLDWMAQGTRVSGNLLHDNDAEDLFVEVNHGPFVVDQNVFLSPVTLASWSQGGAYVHNLIGGSIRSNGYDDRTTPFHKPHSTEIAGLHDNPRGDDRFYNNIFVGRADLSAYDTVKLPVSMSGNVFLKAAKPSKHEAAPLIMPDSDPAIQLMEKPDGFYLEVTFDEAWLGGPERRSVTTALLGKAAIPKVPFEQADGSPLRWDADYSGTPRKTANPTPGPFESPGKGRRSLKVW